MYICMCVWTCISTSSSSRNEKFRNKSTKLKFIYKHKQRQKWSISCRSSLYCLTLSVRIKSIQIWVNAMAALGSKCTCALRLMCFVFDDVRLCCLSQSFSCSVPYLTHTNTQTRMSWLWKDTVFEKSMNCLNERIKNVKTTTSIVTSVCRQW